MSNADLQEHVDYIARRLQDYHNGKVWVDIDGYEVDEDDEEAMADARESCVYDYIVSDVYDIEIVHGLDRDDYRGCRIMIAYGGPDIWIDTLRHIVHGAWWLDTADAWIPSDVCHDIDGYISELVGLI